MLVTVTAKQDQTWQSINVNFASSAFDNDQDHSAVADKAVLTAAAGTALLALSLF